MTTTPTANLKSILDLRNITGSLEEARKLLPIVTKIGAVMAASSEGRISGHADDIAFSMAKALDIIGAVKDPAELTKQAEMMGKVITAMQNRVTPQMFQSVFSYARQGKFDLGDQFKYEILPTLMLGERRQERRRGRLARRRPDDRPPCTAVTNQGVRQQEVAGRMAEAGIRGWRHGAQDHHRRDDRRGDEGRRRCRIQSVPLG